MRIFAIAAMMIAVLSASALAQQRGGGRTARTDEQKRTDAEVDKAYQNVIRNTGDKSQAAPVQDPWGLVRNNSSTPKR
jgi:hypothetical protein